jgi:hypothetical protein
MIWLLSLFLACSGPLQPIAGTAIRVGEVKKGAADLGLHIFRDHSECDGRDDDVEKPDIGLCDPFVDRATGQVRFAFQARIRDDAVWPMTLDESDLIVSHQSQRLDLTAYEVVGHHPVPTRQLFVLMIDVSGSMAEMDGGTTTRMDRLKSALLRNDVISSFFPDSVATAVVPMIFSGGNPRPLADKLVVTNRRDYLAAIQKLNYEAGYTHLYDAIRYASTELLARPEVKQLVEGQDGMSPTIIALTDGFNNEDDTRPPADKRIGKVDVCADNGPRLERLLKDLNVLQHSNNVRARPSVFTVGLGRQARPGIKIPTPEDGDSALQVNAGLLCGRWLNERIDGSVENNGVDNAALEWIASIGRGRSYIKRDTAGLAEAFKAASAKRYKWFDIRYSVDPFYLRRKFDTKIQFVWGTKDDAGTISIHPSAWLDAPPGVPMGDSKWTQAAPFSRSLVVLLPTLGALLSFNYLSPALFNLKRVLFSRIRRRKKK